MLPLAAPGRGLMLVSEAMTSSHPLC
jgi:hypothetical protein